MIKPERLYNVTAVKHLYAAIAFVSKEYSGIQKSMVVQPFQT